MTVIVDLGTSDEAVAVAGFALAVLALERAALARERESSSVLAKSLAKRIVAAARCSPCWDSGCHTVRSAPGRTSMTLTTSVWVVRSSMGPPSAGTVGLYEVRLTASWLMVTWNCWLQPMELPARTDSATRSASSPAEGFALMCRTTTEEGDLSSSPHIGNLTSWVTLRKGGWDPLRGR